jgi:hypothetical protein
VTVGGVVDRPSVSSPWTLTALAFASAAARPSQDGAASFQADSRGALMTHTPLRWVSPRKPHCSPALREMVLRAHHASPQWLSPLISLPRTRRSPASTATLTLTLPMHTSRPVYPQVEAVQRVAGSSSVKDGSEVRVQCASHSATQHTVVPVLMSTTAHSLASALTHKRL